MWRGIFLGCHSVQSSKDIACERWIGKSYATLTLNWAERGVHSLHPTMNIQSSKMNLHSCLSWSIVCFQKQQESLQNMFQNFDSIPQSHLHHIMSIIDTIAAIWNWYILRLSCNPTWTDRLTVQYGSERCLCIYLTKIKYVKKLQKISTKDNAY